MFVEQPSLLASIKLHAAKEQPREACGLIVRKDGVDTYTPCKNIAENKSEHFILDPTDFAMAEDLGEVMAIVHSHPYTSPLPSQADRVMCEKTQLPWVIVNYPVGTSHEHMPCGYEAELLGRPFVHGILDCYTLIQDCFKRDKGIVLPDFERRDDWWDRKDGMGTGDDLYQKHYAEAGFVEVPICEIRPYDVIVMRLKENQDAAHAGVYLGNNVLLHHMAGRLSKREVYGGWYLRCTVFVLRHKQLL